MLTIKESIALSLIRILAIILIVSCHFYQAIDSKLAWWLNVGVQIFFFLSGYLVGFKNIVDYKQWYKKRFIRVLKPYYLYIFIVLPIYMLFINEDVTVKKILAYLFNLQGFLDNLKGLEHLWFIPVIVLCYLIVPFVKNHNIAKEDNSEIKFIGIACFHFFIMQLLLYRFGFNFASGIATFLVGFYFSTRYKTDFPKYIKFTLLTLTIILLPVNIYLQNAITSSQSFAGKIFIYEFAWYHVLLGITIFIFLFEELKKFSSSNYLQQKLKVIDVYSYEVYITHHIYILGTYPLLFITKYIVLNILITLVAICISSYLLKRISNITVYKNIIKRNIAT